VTPLLEARLKILMLLLSFVLDKNFVRVIVVLYFGIGVCDSNIDDSVHSMGPKATYEYVFTIIIAK
jgi:hypothetical protein